MLFAAALFLCLLPDRLLAAEAACECNKVRVSGAPAGRTSTDPGRFMGVYERGEDWRDGRPVYTHTYLVDNCVVGRPCAAILLYATNYLYRERDRWRITEEYWSPTSRMITGGCSSQSSALNNVEYEVAGYTASGAPYYSGPGSYYIYWDPDCDGSGTRPARWIVDDEWPNTDLDGDLDGDGKCDYIAHIDSDYCSSPPSNKKTWTVDCGLSYEADDLTLTVPPLPQSGLFTTDDAGCPETSSGWQFSGNWQFSGDIDVTCWEGEGGGWPLSGPWGEKPEGGTCQGASGGEASCPMDAYQSWRMTDLRYNLTRVFQVGGSRKIELAQANVGDNTASTIPIPSTTIKFSKTAAESFNFELSEASRIAVGISSSVTVGNSVTVESPEIPIIGGSASATASIEATLGASLSNEYETTTTMGQGQEKTKTFEVTWPSPEVPGCTLLTAQLLVTERIVAVPYTATMTPEGPFSEPWHQSACTYSVNGTWSGVSLSESRVQAVEDPNPQLRGVCAGASSPSSAPPPSSPSNSPELIGDPCFPSSATVQRADGETVPLSSLSAGDSILAAAADGTLVFNAVRDV